MGKMHPGDRITVTLSEGTGLIRINDGAEEVAWTAMPDVAIYPAVCFYSNVPTVRLLGVTSNTAAPAAARTGAAASGAALVPPRPPVMPVEEDPEVIRAR
jgi:hypothetical protein